MPFRHPIRAAALDERGATLLELLVVVVIIGILAAVAIVSLGSQRSKSQDAAAKTDVRTAQATLEVYLHDTGSYAGATRARLIVLEPSLSGARALTLSGLAADRYRVSVTSRSSDATVYEVRKLATGRFQRLCDDHGKGGCRPTADAAGNYW